MVDNPKIFVSVDRKEPISLTRDELQAGINSGKYKRATLAWVEGLPKWLPLSNEYWAKFNIKIPEKPVTPPPLPPLVKKTPVKNMKRRRTTPPKVETISANEVVISAKLKSTFDYVLRAMNSLGKVKNEDRLEQFIQGSIKYGFQSVNVRACLVEREAGKTNVVIQASSDDIYGAGAKNATKRLIEVLRNFDNPGYKPDRLGIHPLALVGVLIGFGFLLVLIVEYVLPLIKG